MRLGFDCVTSPTVPSQPTLRQQVVALTDDQRAILLKGFENLIPAAHLFHEIPIDKLIPKEVIDYVYEGLAAIRDRCRQYMRGEVEITPAIKDEQGNITTSAVMNIIPSVQSDLGLLIRGEFKDDYPANFITLVITEIMKWYKFDGNGTFAFYKANIIL